MERAPPSPNHRHQSSREGIISFSAHPLLEESDRARAESQFYQIVRHFEDACPGSGVDGSGSSNSQYRKPLLVRLTYEYARSRESRDIFLRAFLDFLSLPVDTENVDLYDQETCERLGTAVSHFADYLFKNFFLPLRASSGKTPQLSPAIHSAIQRAQGGSARFFTGTPEREAGLRRDCLVRDRYRCVITRRFDSEEANKRLEKDGDEATDDDGMPLANEVVFERLEVAHILPHSLTCMENSLPLV